MNSHFLDEECREEEYEVYLYDIYCIMSDLDTCVEWLKMRVN